MWKGKGPFGQAGCVSTSGPMKSQNDGSNGICSMRPMGRPISRQTEQIGGDLHQEIWRPPQPSFKGRTLFPTRAVQNRHHGLRSKTEHLFSEWEDGVRTSDPTGELTDCSFVVCFKHPSPDYKPGPLRKSSTIPNRPNSIYRKIRA